MRLGEHGAERLLLLIILRSREWVDRASECVGPAYFRNREYRAIFEALAADPHQPPIEGASHEVQAALANLLDDPQEVEHTEKVFLECLADLEDRAVQVEQDGRREALSAASEEDSRAVLGRMREVSRQRGGRWNVVGATGPGPSRQDAEG